MPGRSTKGKVADCCVGFLRFMNIIVILGGLLEIVLMFVLEGNPSFPAGWGFIVVGILTVVSGLFGVMSNGTWGCLGCQLFFLLISTAGLATAFLVIFVAENNVLQNLSHGTNVNRHDILLAVAAICAVLFCLNIFIILFSCFMQNCGFADYYEDLDGNPMSTARTTRQQVQDERASVRRKEKLESSNAHQLAEKMKAKYGSYNSDPQYESQV